MQIFTIGETVLDIIVQSYQQVDLKVGGSMLNTAVSLGRLGLPVTHVSYLAKDEAAAYILQFMQENGVDTSCFMRQDKIKTNLALAFLDADKKANYSFYKDFNASGITLTYPEVQKGDIILFGSFFSLNELVRDSLLNFLRQAKALGAFLLYDPNFRKPHMPHLAKYLPFIQENIALADWIKASDEDLELIYGLKEVDLPARFPDLRNKALIYTKGSQGAIYFKEEQKISVPAVPINPVSTIGAGDTFSAGLIYYLMQKKSHQLREEEISEMLTVSCLFSSEVCKGLENYLSNEFISSFQGV